MNIGIGILVVLGMIILPFALGILGIIFCIADYKNKALRKRTITVAALWVASLAWNIYWMGDTVYGGWL